MANYFVAALHESPHHTLVCLRDIIRLRLVFHPFF